jgi:hypothetical protein
MALRLYGSLSVDEPRDESIEPLITDCSMAQFHLWLAQAQRDKKMISGKELAVVEKLVGPKAKKAKTIYNPFTGEIRKVEI